MRKVDKNVSFVLSQCQDETIMDLLTEEEVTKIARNIASNGNVRLDSYELANNSAEVLGYLGKHLVLTLNLSSAKGKCQRRFFVKTYEAKNNKEDFLGETGIFKREQDFYRIVLEDMKENGPIDWCPEYFFSKERVLVLEDLSEKGFKMIEDGLGPWAINEPHLETALKTLASMHASSILLEVEESKLLPAMYPTVLRREILYDENKPEMPTRKWISWQIQDLLEGVDYLEKYSSEDKIFIKKNFEEQVMRIYRLSKKSEKYRNVLTHGDMWKNNLLFRYSSKNVPEECRFVDFQFIRYAPPAHDVMHMLHYALKKKARDEMGPHYLQVYYENLSWLLRDHGVDSTKEVSKEEFFESCREYKELALIQSLLSLHYILGPVTLNVETESYEKYEDYLSSHRKNYMRKFFQDEIYADKIKDTFHDLIDTYIMKE